MKPRSPFAALCRRLLPYLSPHRGALTAYVTLTVVLAGVELLTPWPMKILVDNVLGDQPLPGALPEWKNKTVLLVAVVAAGVILRLILGALRVLESSVSIRMRQAIVFRMKSDLFQRLQEQSFAFYDRRRLGDLIYRVNNDVWGVDELILTLMPLFVALLTLVGMFWIVAYLNWQIALLTLLIVPFFYLTYTFYSRFFDRRVEEVQQLEGESMSIVQEVLASLRMVKSFTREEVEHGRFVRQGETALHARVQLTTQQVVFSVLVGLITAVGTSLILGFGGYQVLQGSLTLGQLLVVIAYLGSVFGPLASINTAATYTHGYVAKVRRVFEVLDAKPEIRNRPGAKPLEAVSGRVRFEGVSFSYGEDKKVLQEIDLEVAPGEALGIVGPTGAGKTTLVSLIPRFYDPTAGCVRIDGHDVRDVELKSLRSFTSIVMQEPVLLMGTLRENIGYGKLDATLDEIIDAARMANAHEFIARLPDGYDTRVGERGAGLSGGEKQRIAIARAFLKDAPILILDEPTSSVDTRTEAVILEALERLMAGRTTFIVAHRLSTLRNVDRIAALEAGRVVEIGTHEELLAARGLYHELYQRATVEGGRLTAGV